MHSFEHAISRSILLTLLLGNATAQTSTKTTIVISPSTPSGLFLEGNDVGPMNPHSYRPNEFFANDLVFEGLVAAGDLNFPGMDGIKGTPDDGVVPSLASSWNIEILQASKMKITFNLAQGVKFHVRACLAMSDLYRPSSLPWVPDVFCNDIANAWNHVGSCSRRTARRGMLQLPSSILTTSWVAPPDPVPDFTTGMGWAVRLKAGMSWMQ